MSIDRSTQYFTLDGLTVFKENVVKKYFKLNEKDAYINNIIYNAMLEYKRNIVKFVSSKRALPAFGNAGTLYMVPKSTSDARYKPKTNEIWVTSTCGFNTMRFYVNNTGVYIDMPKNEYEFFVLDLNKVEPFTGKNVAILESEETSVGSSTDAINRGSTRWLCMPNVLGASTLNVAITSFEQLYTLGGNIISVDKTDDPRAVLLPIPQAYAGNGDDVTISKSTGEIWFSAPYDGDYLVCKFSNRYTVNAPKNEYGYYVLNINNLIRRRIEYLTIYKPDSVNTYQYRKMGANASIITKYSDLVDLVGEVIAVSLDSNAQAIILSDYEQEFSEQYTVPDDEIWISSDKESFWYNTSNSWSNGTLTEKNEYGFFVLKKGVHFSDNPDNKLHTAPAFGENNSNHGFGYAYTKEDGIFTIINQKVTELYKLCGHIIVCPSNGGYTSNILVAIYPQDTTTSNIVTLGHTSGITVPSDEIWIDSNNWPSLFLRVYGGNNPDIAVELTKNEYGYYVFRKNDFTEYAANYNFDLRFFTSDVDIREITDSANNKFSTGSSTMYYRYNYSNSYRYLYIQNIFDYIGGERVVLGIAESRISIIPDELPVITYTGANGDQFVTYAYENGKYVTLGSTIFDVSDVTIDKSLDSNSIRAVQNKLIYEALNTKYDVADVTENIEYDNNNIVTSRALQAALATKLGWDDLHNITLYQLMRELRFPFNMPTSMYFKIVVYAPLREQDLALYYPKLTQRMQFYTYGGSSFVSTDNKFTYQTYDSTRSKYRDENTGKNVWLQNSFDIAMAGGGAIYLSGIGVSNQIANTSEDIQFTIVSRYPVNMNTLSTLSYKFRAYSTNESTTHSHINRIYVSTYLSPDGVDWHTLQNKTIYNWDDNYEDLNDYIYLIPILA